MIVLPRLALIAALLSPVVLIFDARPWFTLLVLAAFVGLLWSVDWLLAPSPARIGVARRLPTSITLGRSGSMGWLINNANDQPARIRFSEALAPSLNADTRRAELTLAPGRSAQVETDLHPERRGRFALDEIVVRTEGPLGFAARQQPRWLPTELRVFPRFPSRAEAELRIRKNRMDIGTRSARVHGGGSEFDQLRDFTIDDEFRKIDWAATARVGRAIVKTYRAERNQTVINILDNGRLMAGQVAGAPRIEYAMDAIMAVTTLSTRLGDRAGLLAFDKEVRVVVQASNRATQLGVLTNAMFDLEPQFAESDYRGAFTDTLVRFSRRTMLIIHTELLEQTVGEFLLPALPLLTRSHLVVVAAVRDPAIEAWADDLPDDGEEVYRHTAARDALAERDRTTALLRRAGATVIDAPPDKLAARLMDAYLEVKATGRL